MFIGIMILEIQRTGPTAKFGIHAKAFRHKTPITLTEVELLATHLAHEAMTWQLEAQHHCVATTKPSTMKEEICRTTKQGWEPSRRMLRRAKTGAAGPVGKGRPQSYH
jgi:hypothetical protein